MQLILQAFLLCLQLISKFLFSIILLFNSVVCVGRGDYIVMIFE